MESASTSQGPRPAPPFANKSLRSCGLEPGVSEPEGLARRGGAGAQVRAPGWRPRERPRIGPFALAVRAEVVSIPGPAVCAPAPPRPQLLRPLHFKEPKENCCDPSAHSRGITSCLRRVECSVPKLSSPLPFFLTPQPRIKNLNTSRGKISKIHTRVKQRKFKSQDCHQVMVFSNSISGRL